MSSSQLYKQFVTQYQRLAVAIRGPVAMLKEEMLPQHIYKQAAAKAILQMCLGGDSFSAVNSALDTLEAAASVQKLPETYNVERDKMGPWQAFGALAFDKEYNFIGLHRKHPNIDADKDRVEKNGIIMQQFNKDKYDID